MGQKQVPKIAGKVRRRGSILLPSTSRGQPWIWAEAPACDEELGPYTGKWLLRVPSDDVDATWAKVAAATVAGELGIEAKVSTRGNNETSRHAEGADTHVICVYTRDCRDVVDVEQVLAKLRGLGFGGLLTYKEDGATYAGVYGKGASLFVARPGSTTAGRRREAIPAPPDVPG